MIEVYVLSVLIILSNCFWAFITHKLLNKLMSRTFWDYQSSKNLPKKEEIALKDALKNVKVHERGPNDLDSLDEMISKVMPI